MSRALVVLGLLLAGCRTPSSPVDARFLEALEWSGRDAAAPAHEPSAPLWKGVEQRGALSPADAFRITLTQSERIARAAEGYLQSLTLQDRAMAAVLPTLGVQASQFFQNRVASSSTVVATEPNRSEVKLVLTQPIFHGLKEYAGWRQAQSAIEQSRAFFETERRMVFDLVTQAFYNMLFMERQIKVLEDAVKNSRDRFREMQARQTQGIARKTEVLLIETQVASDESQLIRGRQGLDLSRAQLAFLLGRPPAVPLLDDLVEPAVPADPVPLIREATLTRSDLRELDAAIKVAEAELDIVSGDHLPTLDFTGDYYAYRRNFSDFGEKTDWDALFTLTFNLFSGGDIRARQVAAGSQIRVAKLNREELLRRMQNEITAALLTWRSDQELLATLETRRRAAEENFAQVSSEYRQGIAGVSNLEVLVAQNQALTAQLELERQKIQSKLDWIQLENFRGRIPVR